MSCNRRLHCVARLVLPALVAAPISAFAQQGSPAGGEAAVFAEDARVTAIAALIDPLVDRRGGRIGVAVYDAALGTPLYLRRADERLIPASNMKVLTTAAALDRLGPDFQYTTSLYTDGEIGRDGVLRGDLILVGRGDPTLSGRFYADSTTYVFDRFAARLRSMGIRRIDGDLVGDATYFDDARTAPGWDARNLLWYYGARSSALSFNDNVITIEVRPGEATGDDPVISFVPHTEGIIFENAARTTGRRGGRSIGIRRDAEIGGYEIRGRIPRWSGPLRYVVAVEDPPTYAISVLRQRLQRVGIMVDGDDEVVHAWQRPNRDGVTLLASHTSPRMIEVVRVINKRSHNFFAEQVLKTLGAVFEGDGSFAGGSEVVEDVLESLSVDTDDLRIIDGSGLSRNNRLTARGIAELLLAMRGHPHFEEFYDSLLIAGRDGNPRRLDAPSARGNVRSKTGTLRGVSALSGYVTTIDGEPLVFSILINNLPRGKGAAVAIEDAIVERLADFSRWNLTTE